MCSGSTMTDDGRGRLISKYRNKMILGTNITDRPEEMEVLDTILFRMWQLGWLETMDRAERLERLRLESGDCNTCTISKTCRYVPGWGESVRINCPFFMSGEHEGTMLSEETASKREKAKNENGGATDIGPKRGVFIPDITLKMIRDAPLEAVAELMVAGLIFEMDTEEKKPKSYWIEHEEPDGGKTYECASCGVMWTFDSGMPEGLEDAVFFCPECGAKMKRERDETGK